MLEPTTQLTFVDEFTEDRLDAAQAKNVLQGGFMVTANKHKTGRAFQNRSMFYFTAQHEPNWGVEDGNVKRRLRIFKMSPLPNVMGNVTQWLREHAVECIIWAGIMIRRGLEILPLDAVEKRNELFFHYEDVPVDSGIRLQSALSDQLRVVKPIAANLDESMELFANVAECSQVRFV